LGEKTKSLSLEVPAEAIYDGIKETMARYAVYSSDLEGKGLTSPYSLVKDVPNSMLAFVTKGWGAKGELEYTLRQLSDASTEVTIHYKFRLAMEVTIRQEMISLIMALLMLESGYKAAMLKKSPKD
jgi:hypothetical protein